MGSLYKKEISLQWCTTVCIVHTCVTCNNVYITPIVPQGKVTVFESISQTAPQRKVIVAPRTICQRPSDSRRRILHFGESDRPSVSHHKSITGVITPRGIPCLKQYDSP